MGYSNTISTATSAQRTASIDKAYIKTVSEKWQNIGEIRNGEIKITPNSTENTRKKNLHSNAFTFEAKFEMLQTGGEVLLLPTIVNGSTGWLFKLTDAAAVSVSAAYEGWIVATSSQVGTKAKYSADGTPDDEQFVEIMIKGSLYASSMDALVKATLETANFHVSTSANETFSDNASAAGGTIFSYYSSATVDDNLGIQGNIRPCGFSSVELQSTIDPDGYVALGNISKGKIIADFLAQEDTLGRYNVYSVDLDIEYEVMVSDATTLLNLDAINNTRTDVKITLLDGKVFTIAYKLGILCTFENIGDFDKTRTLRFSHKGRILTSEFAALVA
jgi:hypothetical protein